MEKFGHILDRLRHCKWRLPPHYVVLIGLIVLAYGMRLPYFFLSTDSRLWRYEMLYHDEALFLMQGRDVLNGKLPYVGHWDNRPPFGWAMFAILNLLSGENIVAFRALGALYISLSGYVLYRTLADRKKPVAGMLAGIFYIVLASVAQISQSVTYEHIAGLPLSCMLYLLLNLQPGKYHRLHIALFFSFCVLMLTNFILLGPAVALLMPGRIGKNDIAVPPPYKASILWLKELGQWMCFVVQNGMLLLATVLSCYGCIYVIYWINGQGDLLLHSVINGAFAVSRQPMDTRLFTQFVWRWEGFSERFLNSYIYSNEWLTPFMLSVFLCRTGGALLEERGKRDRVLFSIFLLLCSGGLALFLRGGNAWNFPYYLLQIMPIVALAMGYAVAFRMGDARLVMMVVIAWGLTDATRIVVSAYTPLIAYLRGDNKFSSTFLNDRLYQVARELNRFPIAGRTMLVCNEDNILYILTHTENPRYFIFQMFNRTSSYLNSVLGVSIDDTDQTRIKDSHPVAIIGWLGSSCFNHLGDEEKNYSQYVSIQNTVVYMRKDMLSQIRPIVGTPSLQAP